MTGIFDPVLAAIWAFGFFAAVWIGATAGAPFKQRNEARAYAKSFSVDNGSPWVDLTTASQIWEDNIRQEGINAFTAKTYLDAGGIGGQEMIFLHYLVEGANEGHIGVRGRPEYGRETIAVPIPINMPNHGLGDTTHDVIGSDGRRYGGLQVNTDGIKEYVEWLKTGH